MLVLVRLDKKTGQLMALYDDRLLPYVQQLQARLRLSESAVSLTRASHVEPALNNSAGGNWLVDLRPSGGDACVLVDEHSQPFVTRDAALAFERRWIEARLRGVTQPE